MTGAPHPEIAISEGRTGAPSPPKPCGFVGGGCLSVSLCACSRGHMKERTFTGGPSCWQRAEPSAPGVLSEENSTTHSNRCPACSYEPGRGLGQGPVGPVGTDPSRRKRRARSGRPGLGDRRPVREGPFGLGQGCSNLFPLFSTGEKVHRAGKRQPSIPGVSSKAPCGS